MFRESLAHHPNPLPSDARATGYPLQATRLLSRASRDSGETRDPSTPAFEKRLHRGAWIPALATLGRDDNGGNGAICDRPDADGKWKRAGICDCSNATA